MNNTCPICKSGLKPDELGLCAGCLNAAQRRAERRRKPAPEAREDGSLGLNDLEEVLKKDTARIEAQAAKKQAGKKSEPAS